MYHGVHHKGSTTALYDSMTDTEEGQRNIFWFEEVDSTMNKVHPSPTM